MAVKRTVTKTRPNTEVDFEVLDSSSVNRVVKSFIFVSFIIFFKLLLFKNINVILYFLNYNIII